MLSTRTHLRLKDTNRMNVKGWKNITMQTVAY